MILAGFQYKLSWLQKNLEQPQLHLFEESLRQVCKECLPGSLGVGFARVLTLDLTYCLARHSKWADGHIFQAVLLSFLVSEHQLDRKVAVPLIDRSLAVAKQLLKYDPTFDAMPATDRNFLLYVFITTLSANDEEHLVNDLGIGTELLKKIRSSARSFSQSTRSTQHAHFTSGIDATFASIIEDFSQYLAEVPWAIDVYRLRFTCNRIPEFWRGILETHGVNWVLELLVHIGEGEATFPGVCKSMSADLPKSVGNAEIKVLLDYLASVDLLCVNHQKRWTLTPNGCQMTAQLFAHRYAKADLKLETLCRLNPEWQGAVVGSISTEHNDILVNLLRGPSPVHPQSILKAAVKLRTSFPVEQLVELLKRLVENGVTAGIKAAAQKAISEATARPAVE